MKPAGKLIPGLTALCLYLAPLGAPAQQLEPRADIVRAAAQSVVRISADSCLSSDGSQNGSRVGSGFVWPDAGHITTALHVVADCQRLVVTYVEAGIQRPARVTRSLRRADLALLQVENPPQVRVLDTGAQAQPQEPLAAIGLPLNIQTWQETYGHRSAQASRLGDILNPRARSEILALGAPDIGLEIFRLTAVVKPGSSGGPVINRDGVVVGVVDGGLDGGSSALNWAVPSRLLDELRRSEATGAAVSLGPRSEAVFAFETSTPAATPGGPAPDPLRAHVSPVNQEFQCGGRRYFNLATRTVEEVVGTLTTLGNDGVLDDPAGFLAMAEAFSTILPFQEVLALRYDLLVDLDTGATIAIPWGTQLTDLGQACVASAIESNISLLFHSLRFDPGFTNAQLVSQQFDIMAGQAYGFAACEPDFAFLEPVPHYRFDGLIARRQGAYCQQYGSPELSYGIVGYLGRDNSFAGVVAVNRAYALTGPGGDFGVTRDWVAAALAVLLSTYQL